MATAVSNSEVLNHEKGIDVVELGRDRAPDEAPEFTKAPDGGAQAWLVAAGGCAIFFCCLGFANSFGTFEQYYLTHMLFDQSPDKVAWIGSLSAFLQFAIGMVGGPLFDRFGAKVIRPAAVGYVIAIMMLSLCKSYWQIMLVQGVLMGILMGLLQFPAFAAVSQYFEKRRAAALGIVVAGSSIGGIVIPVALAKMLNSSSLGFGWSVRTIGFLVIPFMVFACVVVRARLPPRTTNFWISASFKDRKFVLLIISFFFMTIGLFTPLFFIPTYAVARGIDATLAGYLLAIINASSTFGRIVPGILADKIGRLNIFALAGLATGVVISCLNSARSTPALIVYSIVFGFVSGAIISGGVASFSTCPKDLRDVGTYMGMGMSLSAIGLLIGPPANGALLNISGGFFEVSMFSGAACLIGGLIALTTKLTTPQGILGRV